MINLKYASLAGLLVAVSAMAVLIFEHSIFASGPIAITLQVLAAVLMIWARITFGTRSFHAAANPTEGGLVTTGPYRYFRHPIYAAVMYFVIAAVASHFSWMHLILGLIVIAGLFVRILAEEKLVVKQYPEYAAYAAKTKRIIPFIF